MSELDAEPGADEPFTLIDEPAPADSVGADEHDDDGSAA
jgi:hypothetical protein